MNNPVAVAGPPGAVPGTSSNLATNPAARGNATAALVNGMPPVNPAEVLSTQLSLFFAGIMAISFLGLILKTKRMSWWTAMILLNGLFAALSGVSQLLLPPQNPSTTQAVGQALLSLSIMFEFVFLHVAATLVFPPISKALTIFLHVVVALILTAIPVWRIGLALFPKSSHFFNLSMAETGFEVVYFLMLLVIVIVWRTTKKKVATVLFCVGLVVGMGSAVFFLVVLWKVSTKTINTLLTAQSSFFMIDHVNNVFKRKTSYFIPPERLPGRRPVNSLLVLDFGSEMESRVKSEYYDSHRVKDIPTALKPVPSPLLSTGASQMLNSPVAKSVASLQRPESAMLTPTPYAVDRALDFAEVASPTDSVKTARARANSLPWRIHPALENSMHLTRNNTAPTSQGRKLAGAGSPRRKPVSTLPSPMTMSHSRDQGGMVPSYYETNWTGAGNSAEQSASRISYQATTNIRPETRSLMPPLPNLPQQASPKRAESHNRTGSNSSSRSSSSDRVPHRKGSNASNRSARSNRPRPRKRSDASDRSMDAPEVAAPYQPNAATGTSSVSSPRPALGPMPTIVEANENGTITEMVIPPPPPAAFAPERKPSLSRKPSASRGLQRSVSAHTNASSTNSLFISRFSDASLDLRLDADSNGSPSSNIDPNSMSVIIGPPDSPTVRWV